MIDTHHHIWRQQDLPWLLGPEQPRIFGPYSAIKRDYLIDEYLKDIANQNITKSVYVQANWSPNWFLDEAAWVQSISDATGWPQGIVAFADFTASDVSTQLKNLSQFKSIRGIRQQLHWHEKPEYRFAQSPNLAGNRTFQSNVALLAEYGWCFDLQVFPGQYASAESLVQACPDVTFIVQHAGMIEDTSENGWHAWCKAMSVLAANPNVYVKLSGLGTFIHRVDHQHIQSVIRKTIEIFGSNRCMFGSNFPIEKLWCSYDELLSTYFNVLSDFDSEDVNAIFYDTANAVYRL